ncbi:hypothetical protein [Catellatospora sp. NPDC049133]|uniref:hypothetical protein n=1 Tax=Catellatospora sp. NPDC049133 TaxID=3155499 RepID=UPI0033F4D007
MPYGRAGSPWPTTLVYAADPGRPLICLHTWNVIVGPGVQAAHPEPVLLAAHIGGRPFETAFLRTPEGLRLRPEEPDDDEDVEEA